MVKRLVSDEIYYHTWIDLQEPFEETWGWSFIADDVIPTRARSFIIEIVAACHIKAVYLVF